MYPASFEYYAPTSLDEAISLLEKHGEEARVLAGGHSLIPMMKLRVLRPAYVIDLNRIKGLKYIEERNSEIRIGALTTYYEIITSDIIKRRAPILVECASVVADPQVRNWGTIGGSLSHCDPSGDMGSSVLALRAKMVTKSSSGERVIDSDDWFVGSFQSALKTGEILREIVIPTPKPGSGGSYLKLERKAGDYAIAAVGVQLTVDASGTCTYAGIGLTAVGPTNLRAKKAEQILVGKKIDDRVIEEAAGAASEDSRPSDDPLRGSAEYKRAMVGVLTKRALTKALAKAKASVK
ncbi:MAG: xanthine dehydrogenase family protein subunit M [Thermoprotei archaeon]